MRTAWHSLTDSWIRLWRTPSMTLASLVTLVVGIGASVLVFSVVQAVLLTPLPYANANRLVQLDLTQGADRRSVDVSLQEFADWQTRLASVQDLSLFASQDMTLGGSGQAETIAGGIVSDRFFTLLGTPPAAGRLLTPEDDVTATAVLSHRLWLRRFGGDPAMVGRTITLDGRFYVVAGVADDTFRFPGDVELWIPVGFAQTFAPPQWNMRGFRAFSIIGRLGIGATIDDGRQEAGAAADWLSNTYPRFSNGVTADVISLQERQVRSVRPALLMFLAAVGLVLVVAIANLMNLSLTRNLSRTREFAVRTALGAGRWALVRPVLAEALWLGVMGGGLAVAAAAAGVRLIRSLRPAGWPLLDQVGIDWLTLLAALAVSVIVAMAVGTLPAIKASSGMPVDTLRQARTGGSASARQWTGGLIAVQIAMSIVLLVGGALLMRSLLRVGSDPVGIRAQGVLTLKLNLASTAAAASEGAAVLQRIINNVSAVPGVRTAGVISSLPPAVSQMHTTFSLPDPSTRVPRDVAIQMIAASPQAMATLGVPLLAGRWFDGKDSSDSRRVIVLSETAARQMFGRDNPVGRVVPFGAPGASSAPPEVIGVIGDVKYSGLQSAPDGALYMPVTQRLFDRQYLVVKTQGAPVEMTSAVRSAIAEVDAGVGVSSISTLDDVVSQAGAEPRFRAWAVMALALITVLVSGVGLYNLVSRSVTLQTSEIGLRMALGASRPRVIWFVTSRTLLLCSAGGATGVVAALWLSRFMEGFLFGVRPLDPLSFLLPVAALLSVAAGAAVGPVRRATRIDPLIALRHEDQ